MAAGQMEMPDEIFIKIFSYLQIHDLFRIGGTCKQWRRLSIDSLRQIAKREYNNLMWMEENQNYPVEELIRLVDILVKCGDIYRETLTSKAAGIAQAMENSLPSLDKIAAAAVLANLGYMPTLQFERLFIEDIDLTIVPRCNLASLAACFSIDEIHINNVHSDLTDLLRHLQCQRLFLDNLSLSERATEALVAAMETGVEEVTFDDGWSNIGRRPDYDMTLSMSALSQYSGTGKCWFVQFKGSTGQRYGGAVGQWAVWMGWGAHDWEGDEIVIMRNSQ